VQFYSFGSYWVMDFLLRKTVIKMPINNVTGSIKYKYDKKSDNVISGFVAAERSLLYQVSMLKFLCNAGGFFILA
jgi:hypothetical protein